MNINSQVDKAIQRVMAINWNSFEEQKIPSYKALAREYLRRLVLWTKALNIIDKWPQISFPAAYLFDELPIPVSKAKQLESYLSERTNFHAVHLCLGYVYWESIKEHDKIKKFNFPDPYEPLMIFFERGGYFKPDRGGFLDEIYIPIDNWQEYDSLEPFIALDEKTLNQLDAKAANKN